MGWVGFGVFLVGRQKESNEGGSVVDRVEYKEDPPPATKPSPKSNTSLLDPLNRNTISSGFTREDFDILSG